MEQESHIKNCNSNDEKNCLVFVMLHKQLSGASFFLSQFANNLLKDKKNWPLWLQAAILQKTWQNKTQPSIQREEIFFQLFWFQIIFIQIIIKLLNLLINCINERARLMFGETNHNLMLIFALCSFEKSTQLKINVKILQTYPGNYLWCQNNWCFSRTRLLLILNRFREFLINWNFREK